MTQYLITPEPEVILPIIGMDQLFPVRRVFCVGRNYAEHAREMGDDPSRDLPFFFCKDRTCVQWINPTQENSLVYPEATGKFEYEVELVVALTSGGRNLTIEEADAAVFGYSLGLDMTRRDLQSQAKQKGRPWEAGKSFEASAPMTSIVPRSGAALLNRGRIELSVNGDIKQSSDLSHLTWDIAEVIVKLSELFELHPGDLIMTGTPENVGPVIVGDRICASLEGVAELELVVV
ncbi:fumarylacetoacetate hydrolase family protein [Marinomonas fungiae]|uniref:2-keto-4-pentenoate hydratase/2-oxohepta-3-ene-1,7-dioic acid hydratase (Catechol pathway) n=1 Tax=Marinomonas fungiae TaxID=1137284 RepID=A0A0K6IJ06_9GAMM|nr:fumarylacetoacetate hydrolase family protein [Marinomonas fungiae]CUB03075.1 2-keto-4-pentenoate hydratase/2-oxohepta-3-ene-1,7-dioic acid hydratase (catechol pathway) [Marinomonas fungiae]